MQSKVKSRRLSEGSAVGTVLAMFIWHRRCCTTEGTMNRAYTLSLALGFLLLSNLVGCDDWQPGCGPSPFDQTDGGTSPANADGSTPDAAIPAGGIGSCDFRVLGKPSAAYCQEYIADPAIVSVYKSNCTSSGGAWLDGGCPHTGSLGACGNTSTRPPIVTIRNWFYLGGSYSSAQYLQAMCEGNKDVYTAP